MDSLSLYDRDFYLWTRAQAEALRRLRELRPNGELDWDNLIEEVESLGRSDRYAVESQLERLIHHLLKLEHSPAVDPRRGWLVTVDDARTELARRLSTSLKAHLADTLAERYRIARRAAERDLAGEVAPDRLPPACPYSLDHLLDPDWLPDGRPGPG
ncbi:MAG: hypothetical protein RLY86_1813 [Pseudomonadota bacterium]|jgi:hypothetical protein